ncbi:MAG: YidC/Oxa1 family membrane protein insertase [Acidimicrobiales bacterium]
MSGLALPPMLAENSLFKTVGDIFHPLFELVATVLAFIYGVVPTYGVAIILLTVLIMALLTPLTIKSTKSMLAMQGLQPEMQKLRQKYKGAENREQLNQEMMRLYREHGVSPTGGCLPMFLQMPALIVLYDVIRGLANTIGKGTKFPTTAVLPLNIAQQNAVTSQHGTVTWAKRSAGNNLVYVGPHHGSSFHALACTPHVGKVCAVPRYIPSSSTMFHHLVNTPGVMKSFGLNLASKPLTHHANWWDYIPYLVLVAVAVGLQYFQMSQMTKRNKGAAQANPQMQTMQKVMPLIFAYIYFIIPVGVVLYMIVSSGIRILTQDLIFRYGLVQRPGERELGAERAPKPGVGDGAAGGAAGAIGTGDGGSGEARGSVGRAGAAPTGQGRGAGTKGRAGGGAGNGRGSGVAASKASNGNTDGNTGPKAHPRSKSKRARKAR